MTKIFQHSQRLAPETSSAVLHNECSLHPCKTGTTQQQCLQVTLLLNPAHIWCTAQDAPKPLAAYRPHDLPARSLAGHFKLLGQPERPVSCRPTGRANSCRRWSLSRHAHLDACILQYQWSALEEGHADSSHDPHYPGAICVSVPHEAQCAGTAAAP